jgi:hypothetical protein
MLAWILPKQRSMDNVPTGWARPQEDEFALVSLGARSPYRTIAFPNRPPVDSEYLDMRGLSREELSAWQAKLRQFISALTIREQKPIVLKSPPHTGRVAALLELFPDARFIHIVRDPLSIYPSTERLWKALDRDHALQMPRHERLSEYVFDSFERMYAAYREDRAALDPSRLVEIRYEDLAADPVGQVEAIYEKLSLGEFERVRPKLNAIAAAQPEYKTNRYRIDADLHREIVRRWKWYFDEYDYPVDEEPS